MNVSAAVASRRSVRAFRSDPVPIESVLEILRLAVRAPSGSNLQPWKVYVLAGEARDGLVEAVERARSQSPEGEGLERVILPADLPEFYRRRYIAAGERLYGSIGVERDDAEGRYRHRRRNWTFFGAPVGLMVTLDRRMQPGQWGDVGMFLQTVMLLAREQGLDTCAQESWCLWHKTLRAFLSLTDDEMIYCGMAIGHADETAAINQFESERAPFEENVTLVGRP